MLPPPHQANRKQARKSEINSFHIGSLQSGFQLFPDPNERGYDNRGHNAHPKLEAKIEMEKSMLRGKKKVTGKQA